MKGTTCKSSKSSKSSQKVAKNRCVFSLLCARRVVLLVTFAKMMFDEAELFKGLTAWFSSSVSASVQSQWGKLHVVSKTAKLRVEFFFAYQA